MTCATSGKNYIAQTGTILADRILVNKQKIKDHTHEIQQVADILIRVFTVNYYSFLFYKVKEEN